MQNSKLVKYKSYHKYLTVFASDKVGQLQIACEHALFWGLALEQRSHESKPLAFRAPSLERETPKESFRSFRILEGWYSH